MDAVDMKILRQLNKNGRATASEISRNVNLSVPAVAERIRKLEQGGVIEEYMVKLNRKAMDQNLMAFVFVNIDSSEHIGPFRERIVAEACVLECHHIAGPNDYLLKIAVSDTDELERFISQVLKKIEGVVSSSTVIRLATLKEKMNAME